MIGYELLKTGTLVSFRIVDEEVLSAPDEAEFSLRLQLKFTSDEGEEVCDAKPRNSSVLAYEEKDEFRLADFIERLRFVRGELHFDADYIRGRRVKTRVLVRSNGTVTLETIGRGKAALRWLERMQGKKLMHLVGQSE